MLPMLEFLDNYNRILVMVITYLLIISPVVSFITIKFKRKVKILIKYWFKWCSWKIEYVILSSRGNINTIETRNTTNDAIPLTANNE